MWVALDLILTRIKQFIKEVVNGDVIVFFSFVGHRDQKLKKKLKNNSRFMEEFNAYIMKHNTIRDNVFFAF
jgi:hypothetical protein